MSSCERLRIVIAEDDPKIQELYCWAFDGTGHSITMCDDGVTALEVIEKERPDVIITDIKMPEIDGITDGLALVRKLRERGNRTPIIVSSADLGTREVVAFLNSGLCKEGVVRMPKPFDLGEPLRLAQKVHAEAIRNLDTRSDFAVDHDPSIYFSF